MKRTTILASLLLAVAPGAAAAQDAPPAAPPEPMLISEPPPPPPPAPEPDAAPEPAPSLEWDEAAAAEPAESLQLHGWISQGVMSSVRNNYLAHTTRNSFEMFEAGLNVTKELGTNVRAGLQIFAQDLGPIGEYAPTLDWAYVDYKHRPWLGVRAGRVKMPLYLYNEVLDADMTRTTVLMPQGVYDLHLRDITNAINGADVYGEIELGGAGSLGYDVYAGTVYIHPRQGDSDFDNALGARVTWDAPGCMRASAHGVYATFDLADTLSDAERDAVIAGGGAPPDWDGVVSQAFDRFSITGGALECVTERVTLTAEGTVWRSDVSTTPMLEEPGEYVRIKAYAQAEYRLGDRVSAATYLSIFQNRDRDHDPVEDRYHQYDAALAARVDITSNWLVKAEVHAIDGYGLTEGSLNRDRERAARWGMFLAKTTLSF